MPSLRVLHYFIAVAETGHFGLAAERCDVTQSTLSGQLRRFEDYLGVSLLDRSMHGSTLTPAGQRILPLAHKMLATADQLFTAAQVNESV